MNTVGITTFFLNGMLYKVMGIELPGAAGDMAVASWANTNIFCIALFASCIILALALGGSFAFDPFEGIEVLFSDYATAPIIGDLSGVLANYPNGDNVQFKYDDATLMTSDLVRILGRKPVAIGVVGNNYFAKIST